LIAKPSVLLLVAGLAAAGQPDFRQASWGMTPVQVRATESAQPAGVSEGSGDVILSYDSIRLGGLECRAVYIFANDRLVRAKYLFEADHDELNDFIQDFKSIELLLAEKHGKRSADRAIWEDDSTQLEPKSYLDQDRATAASILPSDPLVGLAVSLGHLKLYTRWDTARSIIVHVLTGHDHRITHQVEYRSAESLPRTNE
jgi:hypothetical protein